MPRKACRPALRRSLVVRIRRLAFAKPPGTHQPNGRVRAGLRPPHSNAAERPGGRQSRLSGTSRFASGRDDDSGTQNVLLMSVLCNKCERANQLSSSKLIPPDLAPRTRDARRQTRRNQISDWAAGAADDERGNSLFARASPAPHLASPAPWRSPPEAADELSWTNRTACVKILAHRNIDVRIGNRSPSGAEVNLFRLHN
jgi:hypothetical protein